MYKDQCKWIEEFNLKLGNYCRKKKIRKSLQEISTGSYFRNRIPIVQEIRVKIEKWDCIKLKSFCTSKESIIRVK
jgi:hypothetical protein